MRNASECADDRTSIAQSLKDGGFTPILAGLLTFESGVSNLLICYVAHGLAVRPGTESDKAQPTVNLMPSVQPLTRESSPRDFQALDLAFLGSLLPGIIHNWATPLSGVIGATQLLEKRASVIEDLLKDFEQLSGAERDELRKQLDRNRTNVDILRRNAQHLADQLQILVYRITRGSGVARDFFSLNELVQNELRFLEANLHFKHKVRKQISLTAVVPATAFSYGYVAAAIDELITYTIARHDPAQGILEMDFVTGPESGSAIIRIEARICATDSGDSRSDPLNPHLMRLSDDGWTVDFTDHANRLSLTLQRPQKQSMP